MYRNVHENGHYREIVSVFCAKMYNEWHLAWIMKYEYMVSKIVHIFMVFFPGCSDAPWVFIANKLLKLRRWCGFIFVFTNFE